MEATKNPVGRPTDYKPEYCERVVALGKEGKSHVQIAAELDVAKSTLYLWKDEHPEFSDALNASRSFAQAWWETIGQGQMLSPLQGFSASLWAKQVSARFPDDYTEKSKQEVTGDLSGLTVRFVKGTEDAG
jgi:transposase-like protein